MGLWSLYRTLSVRHLRQRWSRAGLIVLSIALGVATLVATRSLNQGMRAAAQSASSPLAGLADLAIDNGEAGVSRDLMPGLRAIPGVRAVEPVLIQRVLLPELDNRPALLLGMDLRAHIRRFLSSSAEPTAALPWQVRVEVTNPLALLPGRRPVLIGKALAARLPATLELRAGGAPARVTVLGTLDAPGPAAEVVGSLIVMDATEVAAWLGRPTNLVTRLEVSLEADADRETVRREIAALVAGQATVRRSEVPGQGLQDVLAGLELGFALCGTGALVVGLFLVYNALAVSVTERRHEIGILRSLGATRSQVAGLFAAEAAVLGLVGALVGVLLGLALAEQSLGPVQQMLHEFLGIAATGQLGVTVSTVVFSALAGVATALAAAVVPAWQAAMDEPADAVRRAPARAGARARLLHLLASLVVLGVGLLAVAVRERLPERVGTFGGLMFLVLGLLLLTPLLAAGVAGMLRPLTARLRAIEARLAADNLARSPARTGLVIAAWAAGVALMLQTAGVTRSNEVPILDWIERSLTADLFLTCGGPLNAGGQGIPLAESLAHDLEKIPGVRRALPVRFLRPTFRQTVVLLLAFDTQAYFALNRHRAVPGIQDYPQLREEGTALVSANFAALHRVGIGDRIALTGPRGPVELRVVGTFLDYSWNRGTVLVDRQTYLARFQDPLVDLFDVYLEPLAASEAEQRVRQWAADQALAVTGREELVEQVRGVIRRVFGVAYVQEAVLGIVAALGVVMALLISVLQRQRELGLLRAIGATRAQLMGAVLAEALLLGVIGTVSGLLVGPPLEWYVLRVIILEESGFLFPVLVPWRETGVLTVLALAIAGLAGLGPAWQAMRLRITEAIAYE
ncbi:MAG: FtsX-like permease family protein [Gemmataceae bacterium]|nr:FtsX-like permease family protein [Gemmataceae bacterium]MDW8266371.1 FtsX-like permease family protein [Gemmataceae bacterium]